LVVEDSADVCRYIRGALEPQYKVIEAKDGQEGIEKALQVIPDLIVSDIMMPRVDGYQLVKTLKQDRSTSHIPIILLTAKAAEENILEGLETGVDDYITKPFSTRILCARIKNLIDLRRQMQQNHHREMTLKPIKTKVSSVDREFFKDLHQVIDSNLSDPDFNVEQLANKLYMGRSTVYRKIEALCGENPTDYIRSYRLKRAAQLLQTGTASVTDVAFNVGFNSRTYFTRCFKEMFHQLPSDFRNSP
ncbi:MAG TPA: response regulator, partial [Candidatus Deferrimicrobium sp.]|nr:response regulator [Candidatus Deferrimicrobium sp.]